MLFRSICRFCGHLGHEMIACPDHLKLTALLSSPIHADKYNSEELLAPKKGPWICNSGLIPRPQPLRPRQPKTYKSKYSQSAKLKRPFESASPIEEESDSPNLLLTETDQVTQQTAGGSPTAIPNSKKPKPARHVSPANL